MTDTRLELEYFERIEVNPRLTLLRVGGSPAPDESALALVVSVDGEDYRTTPLGGSVSVEESGRWRAAFPVPTERLDGSELSYTLETGDTVELPDPAVRVLPDRAAEAATAPAADLPDATEAAAIVVEPVVVEEVAPEEEPAVAEELALEEEPPVEEEPAVAEEPALEEEPAVAEEPAAAEEPAVTEEPTATKEPEEPPPTDPGGADVSGLAPAPRRGQRWWIMAVLILLVAVVIAVIVIVVASNSTHDNGTPLSKNSSGGGRTPASLQGLPEAPKGAAAKVTPISDGRSTLTVSGLATGTYEAWLYNDIINAKPLATFHGPEARVTLKFPADVGHFHDLDVSREGDGNPGHSGQSVLRVPLASLTG